MKIQDSVYGEWNIEEPLLLDLLNSAAVQRLQQISQAGASSLVRKGRSVTRFEHSVGVMILTRRLGGGLHEQAAGLLQDISHTAFSHTIDYVFADRKEEFHERILEQVVRVSDLPDLLDKYGLSWDDLCSPRNMKIVDAKAPLLCSDRIDYTLRDLLRFGHLTQSEISSFVDNLRVIDGVITCSNIDTALIFVEWYRFLVENLFMNPLELFAHDEFSKIIRKALSCNVIEHPDLFRTDPIVLKKIRANSHLAASLDAMIGTSSVLVGPGPDARRVFSKARIVDPPVAQGDELVPVSHLTSGFEDNWKMIQQVGAEGVLLHRVQ